MLDSRRRGFILSPLPAGENEARMPTTQEQRGTRRFALRLPVSVHFDETANAQAIATTKDVSARGVFFYFDTPIAEGSPLEFTLTLPPEITLTDSIQVRCK